MEVYTKPYKWDVYGKGYCAHAPAVDMCPIYWFFGHFCITLPPLLVAPRIAPRVFFFSLHPEPSRFPFYLSISLSLMLSRAGALGGVVIRWLKLLIHYLFFQSWEKRKGQWRRRMQKQSHLCVCILEGRAIKLRFFCFPSFFMHSLSLSLSFFFLICVFWLNS